MILMKMTAKKQLLLFSCQEVVIHPYNSQKYSSNL